MGNDVLGHKPPSQPVTTSLAARHQLKCSGSILSMQYISTKSSGAPDAWLNAQGQSRFSESLEVGLVAGTGALPSCWAALCACVTVERPKALGHGGAARAGMQWTVAA